MTIYKIIILWKKNQIHGPRNKSQMNIGKRVELGFRVWYIIKNLRQKAVRLKWDEESGLEKNLNSSLSYGLVWILVTVGLVTWEPKMHDEMLNGVYRICLWLFARQLWNTKPIERKIYDQSEIVLRLRS